MKDKDELDKAIQRMSKAGNTAVILWVIAAVLHIVLLTT